MFELIEGCCMSPSTAAKAKYKELLAIKANLEADNQELTQKYAQKAQ